MCDLWIIDNDQLRIWFYRQGVVRTFIFNAWVSIASRGNDSAAAVAVGVVCMWSRWRYFQIWRRLYYYSFFWQILVVSRRCRGSLKNSRVLIIDRGKFVNDIQHLSSLCRLFNSVKSQYYYFFFSQLAISRRLLEMILKLLIMWSFSLFYFLAWPFTSNAWEGIFNWVFSGRPDDWRQLLTITSSCRLAVCGERVSGTRGKFQIFMVNSRTLWSCWLLVVITTCFFEPLFCVTMTLMCHRL